MTNPDLIIGYEGDGMLVSAVCSSCGEWMNNELKLTDSTEALASFAEKFKAHMQQRHPLPIAG